MEPKYTEGKWEAALEGGRWKVVAPKTKVVASVEKSSQEEANAKLIAASPMMFEALWGLVQLIGEEDLPDNGELSGAAICDLARSALDMASGKKV